MVFVVFDYNMDGGRCCCLSFKVSCLMVDFCCLVNGIVFFGWGDMVIMIWLILVSSLVIFLWFCDEVGSWVLVGFMVLIKLVLFVMLSRCCVVEVGFGGCLEIVLLI